MKYIKTHSTIPVPEVYFFDMDPNNRVGAQFMIIEKLPGKSLYDAWDNDLSFDDLLSIVTDIAHIHVQLSALHFDQIGSIKANGTIGPVYYPLPDGTVGSMGPFTSTREYLLSHLPPIPSFQKPATKFGISSITIWSLMTTYLSQHLIGYSTKTFTPRISLFPSLVPIPRPE